MQVTLKVVERFALANRVLPKQGTFEDLILSEDVHKKVDFTQDETVALKMKTTPVPGTQFVTTDWDKELEPKYARDVEFSEAEFTFVKKVFKELSEAKKMSVDLLDLYRIFNKDFVAGNKSAAKASK